MRQRGWLWVGGTALTLLLAAWVSGAGSISALSTPSPSPSNDTEFGELIAPDLGDNRIPFERVRTLDTSELVASVVKVVLLACIAAVVALVLVLVVRALLRRLRPDPLMPKEEVRAELVPDVLLAGLHESEAQLDHGTSSEAVINAWLTLERTAVEVGMDDDRSRTPTELVTAFLAENSVDERAIARLAELYREARFSRHRIGEKHRQAARQAIHQVRADLLRPLGVATSTTRSP